MSDTTPTTNPTPGIPTTGPAPTLRFTKATRRGLADVLALVRDSFDDNAPGSPAQVAKWTKKRERELHQAMAWIEANSTPKGGA
jgi:hypothetical protein